MKKKILSGFLACVLALALAAAIAVPARAASSLTADHYEDAVGGQAGCTATFTLDVGNTSCCYYLQAWSRNMLCTTKWGEQYGTSWPLYVTIADAYSSGTSDIMVTLRNASDDSVLASVVLQVQILGEEKPEGFSNFIYGDPDMRFRDVTDITAWYYNGIAATCAMGLVKGESDTYFNRTGTVTLAEAVTMAARLHSIYYNDGASFTQGTPWYQVYVNYAKQNGILKKDYGNYNRVATRGEFAEIFAAALPEEALAARNDVYMGQIPDVPGSRSDAAAIYTLYRAGILTGNDAQGTYAPDSSITRQEMATLAARMALLYLRKSFFLKS